jgi:histidinol phosphatase-like PHP family hydrolase
MEIVCASTKEQEEYINYLVNYFYTNIFPYYFDDEQIQAFENLQILSLKGEYVTYNGTMKEAFQIISSLQSLITVIEYVGKSGDCKRYRDLFERNIELLRRYGIAFPFTIEQFMNKRHYPCSMYLPSQSSWLM